MNISCTLASDVSCLDLSHIPIIKLCCQSTREDFASNCYTSGELPTSLWTWSNYDFRLLHTELGTRLWALLSFKVVSHRITITAPIQLRYPDIFSVERRISIKHQGSLNPTNSLVFSGGSRDDFKHKILSISRYAEEDSSWATGLVPLSQIHLDFFQSKASPSSIATC